MKQFNSVTLSLASTPRKRAAQERFERWKYGMFIHWGIYSLLGRGEWVKFNENISHDEYAGLARKFNPTHYDPEAWADLMAEGGMRYAVVTARHHDGFSMFDTAHGRDWSVMQTPYGRDPMKPLVKACRKRGIEFFFYYSLLDWTRADYQRDFQAYLSFMNAQLAELCENYGRIAGVWFDGVNFISDWRHWDFQQLFRTIRHRQPEALICVNQAYLANTNQVTLHDDVDFVTYEVNDIQPLYQTGNKYIARETCQTINRRYWGFNTQTETKPFEELRGYLQHSIATGGNLLLNTGPQPDGRIPQSHEDRYREIGRWLRPYAEAVYGTRHAGLVTGEWGGAVATDDAVFLHVWAAPKNGELQVEAPARAVESATLVGDKSPLTVTQSDRLLTVQLPKQFAAPAVIRLQLTGPARWSKIQCEDYLPGGNGLGYHVPLTHSPAKEFYRKDDVGCQPIAGEVDAVAVQVRRGMRLIYHVQALAGSEYDVFVRARTVKDTRATAEPLSLAIEVNSRRDSLALSASVEADAFSEIRLGRVELNGGENYISLVVESGTGQVDYLKFIPRAEISNAR